MGRTVHGLGRNGRVIMELDYSFMMQVGNTKGYIVLYCAYIYMYIHIHIYKGYTPKSWKPH